MIVIASSGRISFPLHAWPPGSRLCQLTQTRYHAADTNFYDCDWWEDFDTAHVRLSTPMKSVAFIIVIASSGRISFPLHAWPPGSRLCQLTQTRYQLTQTRYGEFRLSTPMKSVAFMIVIDFTSGRISFPSHSWPLGSRLCQLTQTRSYQLTQT